MDSSAGSDSFLASIVESCDEAIIGKSLDGTIQSWNRGAEQLYGYGAGEMIGRPITVVVPPDRRDELARFLELIRRGECVEHLETIRRRKDGTLIDVSVAIWPIRDPTGQITHAAALVRDITKQKQVEREHQQSLQRAEAAEAKFRELLEVTPDAIVTVDRAGAVVLMNDQAAKLFGYPREELLDQPVEILVPARFRDQHGEHRADYSAAPRIRLMGNGLELSGRRKDGSEFPVEISLGPLETPEGLLTVVVIRDITERKEAEEARARAIREEGARAVAEAAQAELRTSRDQLAAILAGVAELTRSLDYAQTLSQVAHLAVPVLADWCVVDLLDDHGQLRRLAVTHVDPAKKCFAEELLRRYPADPRAPEMVWHAVQTGRSVLIPEITDAGLVANAQDAEHLAILRSLQMRSAIIAPLVVRGRTLGAITLVRAETGHRYGPGDLAVAEDLAVRAALAIDNARLYGEAQEQAETQVKLNAALRDAMTRLEESLRMRDEFLALVSHDLKNPLSVVKGMTQLLARELASDTLDVDRAARELAVIDAAATKLTGQINGLIDSGRLRLGQPFDLAREPTDLVDLVRRIVGEYQATTTIHRILVDVTESSLVGNWDSGRLERVIGNLLANAIKYSPEGGTITVLATREAGYPDNQAVLQVQDEGLGIPAADLPRLFEPYQRGANVAGQIPGIGLGLASIRRVVRQHGGDVTVESVEGEGSTFTVRLPLADAPPP